MPRRREVSDEDSPGGGQKILLFRKQTGNVLERNETTADEASSAETEADISGQKTEKIQRRKRESITEPAAGSEKCGTQIHGPEEAAETENCGCGG